MFPTKATIRLKVKGQKKIYRSNISQKIAIFFHSILD